MSAPIVSNRPAPRRDDVHPTPVRRRIAAAAARRALPAAHHLSFFRHVSFRYSHAPHIRPSAPAPPSRRAPRDP
ncbi:hypothetical protein MYA_2660 [Burkholderia sp. KJ006]|nr:hypothetical protein MYA_2660 [Burkholderia sp. KJ006]